MRHLTGSVLVMLAAVCFGFMGLFGSWAMRAGVSVEMMLFLRFAVAGIVMAIAVIARGSTMPTLRVVLALIAMGGVLYVGEAMFFFHAMKHIPVGMVSLLLYVYPAVVTIAAWLFLRESITRGKIVALALASAGLLLTIVPTIADGLASSRGADANPTLGVLLGLGCCFSYALYILVGGPVARRAGAITGSSIIILSAAAVLGCIALARGDAWPNTPHAWWGIILLAVVSTVISITAVLVGLARIGPVRTSMISTLEPVVTVIVGAAFMNEAMSAVQVAGGVLIVTAAIVIARAGHGTQTAMPADAPALEAH
jgi:drug/metabolite transporter (DMT)-like permease